MTDGDTKNIRRIIANPPLRRADSAEHTCIENSVRDHGIDVEYALTLFKRTVIFDGQAAAGTVHDPLVASLHIKLRQLRILS